MVGEIIGHFRILEKLGAGGMGEVYKAEDTNLHRFVAVKFLPAEMTGSKSARERFEREARAIAGLNHPNICVVHDFGERDGKLFLVMELLEGHTLRDQVHLHPPRPEQLLEWAIQIAEGLEAAHRRGIIHRDLKPANLFITRHNQAKILDFGLARLEAPQSLEDMLDAETRSLPAPQLTSPGSTLGTVAYMSPEQARSEEIDARSDLFSFGVVLYEAATGKACFQARSTAETFQRILSLTPDKPSLTRPDLPADLDRIILRCLEKDAGLRYQTAGDLRSELKRLHRDMLSAHASPAAAAPAALPAGASAGGPVSTPATPGPAASAPLTTLAGPASTAASDSQIVSALLGRHRRGLAAAAGVFCLILILLGYGWHARHARELRRQIWNRTVQSWRNAQISRLTSSGKVVAPAAISPDGNYVAYVHRGVRGQSLWLRQVKAASGAQIVAPRRGRTMQYSGLAFTQDSGFLDFVEGDRIHNSLYQVPVLGGTPSRIPGNIQSAPAYSPHGRRMAYIHCDSGANIFDLMLAGADGSRPHILASAASLAPNTEFLCSARPSLDSPVWSPDGKWIAAAAEKAAFEQIAVFNAATGKGRFLGPKLVMINGLAWLPHDRAVLAAAYSRPSYFNRIWLISFPRGKISGITNGLDRFNTLSLTSDGRTLSTVDTTILSSVWEQLPGRPMRQLLAPAHNSQGLKGISLLPGGGIVYGIAHNSLTSSFYETAFGQAAPRRIAGPGVMAYPKVSPDGATLAYTKYIRGTGVSIMVSSLHGNHARIFASSVGDFSFTPDGKAITYITFSGAGHLQHLFMRPLAGGPARQLSPYFAGGFFIPTLSPHGRRALLETHDQRGQMIAVIFPLAHPRQTTRVPIHFQMEWMPNGKGLSYVLTQNGADNIWEHPWQGADMALTHFAHQQIRSYVWLPNGTLAVARAQNRGAVELLQPAR